MKNHLKVNDRVRYTKKHVSMWKKTIDASKTEKNRAATRIGKIQSINGSFGLACVQWDDGETAECGLMFLESM